jgi:hypothetical protein
MRTRQIEMQTLARAYRDICTGEDPWIALGKFMHDFFGNSTHWRRQLVRDPIQPPEHPTREQRQWAAFCAASAEYLCGRYNLPRPDWAHDPAYTLAEPWYNDAYADLPGRKQELEAEAPEAFKRHNIYCSSRIYANKYEIREDLEQRRRSAARSSLRNFRHSPIKPIAHEQQEKRIHEKTTIRVCDQGR